MAAARTMLPAFTFLLIPIASSQVVADVCANGGKCAAQDNDDTSMLQHQVFDHRPDDAATKTAEKAQKDVVEEEASRHQLFGIARNTDRSIMIPEVITELKSDIQVIEKVSINGGKAGQRLAKIESSISWTFQVVLTAISLSLVFLITVHETWAHVQQQTLFSCTSRFSVQAISLYVNVINLVDFAAFIPASYDVALFLRLEGTNDAMVSGVLVCIGGIFYPVGSALGAWVYNAQKHQRNRFIIVCCFVFAAGANFAIYVLLSSPAFEGWRLFASVLAFRAFAGFTSGLNYTLASTMAFEVTPRDEVVALSIAEVVSNNAGFALGPLVFSCVMALGNFAASAPVTGLSVFGVAMTQCAIGIIWLSCGLLLSLTCPVKCISSESSPEDETYGESRSFSFEKCSFEMRTTVVALSILFGLVRAFTVSAVEVATAFTLETDYGWQARNIGFAFGGMCAIAALWSIAAIAMRYAEVGTEHQLLHGFTIVGTLSVGLLFRTPILSAPWVILFGDALLYAMYNVAGGIADGIGIQAAAQNTYVSVAWYQAYKNMMQPMGRFIGPPVARLLVDLCGWNAYVGAQLFLTVCGYLIVRTLLTIAPDVFHPAQTVGETAVCTG